HDEALICYASLLYMATFMLLNKCRTNRTMDEKSENGVHRFFQISENGNPVWHNGKSDSCASPSTNPGNYSMGRHMLIVDTPYKFPSENGIAKPDDIFDENVGPSRPKDFRDGRECASSSNHSEPHDFETERKGSKIPLRRLDSLLDRIAERQKRDRSYQQKDSRNKSEHDADIVFECPNQPGIQKLHTCLGQLLRIGAFCNSAWTKETPKTPCCLVFPDTQPENHANGASLCQVSVGDKLTGSSCNNPLIVVEMVDPSNCSRIATSLGLDLHIETPQDVIRYVKEHLFCYIDEVRGYGFNHIIIIGQRYCGMLFLDCYGRVFDLDNNNNILWFHCDYFEKMTNKADFKVPWHVLDDGTLFDHTPKYLAGVLDSSIWIAPLLVLSSSNLPHYINTSKNCPSE
ncbi:11666_t:CDS:2, partial [Ambispora leptoticha]